ARACDRRAPCRALPLRDVHVQHRVADGPHRRVRGHRAAVRPPAGGAARHAAAGGHGAPRGQRPTPKPLARAVLAVCAWVGTTGAAVAQLPAQTLEVSPTKRFLQWSTGEPFFYLGDTAWQLFFRLDADEVATYLEDRARKGFTVIQAVVLADGGGLTEPNANGDLPLVDRDPTRLNEAYFRHVDASVERANALGLVVGLLPTWGTYWKTGPDAIFTPENARVYGRTLGARYRDRMVIWILGGDH